MGLKIKTIKYIDEPDVAYDVSVDSTTHTYPLSNGVFTHNSLRVPKQFFGVTDDNAGFSGGQSLSIISSRYAKMIKRIQATMCQMVTDMINLILLDTNNEQYINNFSIKMLPPTTQEEIDRRENVISKVGLVRDIMDTLADIENPEARLRILKSLLSTTINDPDVIAILEEQIEALNTEVAEATEESMDADLSEFDSSEPLDLGSSSSGGMDFDSLFGDTESDVESSTDLESGNELTDTSSEESDNLPTPDELDIGDVSDSTNPAFA